MEKKKALSSDLESAQQTASEYLESIEVDAAKTLKRLMKRGKPSDNIKLGAPKAIIDKRVPSRSHINQEGTDYGAMSTDEILEQQPLYALEAFYEKLGNIIEAKRQRGEDRFLKEKVEQKIRQFGRKNTLILSIYGYFNRRYTVVDT